MSSTTHPDPSTVRFACLIVAELMHLPLEEHGLTAETELASIGFDSLDLVEAVMAMEDDLGWSLLPEHEHLADAAKTVGDLAALPGLAEALLAHRASRA
jgi:acyl carrier protein